MSRAICASSALTSKSLQSIRQALLQPQARALRSTIACEQTPTPWAPADLFPPKAAIMIPLMNIDGVPNLLVQIRAAELRVHAGEISFPGGKHENSDTSSLATALRETSEELGFDSGLIEPLGQIRAPEDERVLSLGNRYELSAFAGFIHPSTNWHPKLSPTSDLFSLPTSDFKIDTNEVAQILPIPLSTLLDPARHSIHHFRLRPERPYYKVDVSDLVSDRSLVGDGLEIWGLSGWYLNLFLRSLGLMREPASDV